LPKSKQENAEKRNFLTSNSNKSSNSKGKNTKNKKRKNKNNNWDITKCQLSQKALPNKQSSSSKLEKPLNNNWATLSTWLKPKVHTSSMQDWKFWEGLKKNWNKKLDTILQLLKKALKSKRNKPNPVMKSLKSRKKKPS
jgi:hypothetical protein